MKLHLGVIEVPEIEEGSTSYTVGKDLEARYGLFTAFANTYGEKIAKNLAEGAQGALETLLLGNKVSDPFVAGTEQITADFKHFISSQEAETVGLPGVPTQAALMGKSTRFKGKAKRGARPKGQVTYGVRRPSFIDSGIFINSLKTWIE